MSVTAGTIFHRSHQPLTVWFRVMWLVTSQQNGVIATSLYHSLGLGSYQTAWTMLQKLRRAMVRPGRDRLLGTVDIDETYWGGEEKGVIGRLTREKAIVIVAAEHDGAGIGRIRLGRVDDLTKATLHGFISQSVEPGSTVITDGLPAYMGLSNYTHDRQVQRRAIGGEHLEYYLDEFTFRFNRRRSRSHGKLFYRLAQQAMQVEPISYKQLIHPNR